MKKNDFIKIIEAIVRKEVKKQLSEIFINEQIVGSGSVEINFE